VNQQIFPAYSMHPRSERLYDVGPKCVKELWTEEFLARLKRAGARPAEAADCALNNTQRGRSRDPAEVLRREASPEGHDNAQRAAFREIRDAELAEAAARVSRARQDVVDAAAWRRQNSRKERVRAVQLRLERTLGLNSLNSWVKVSRLLLPGSLLRCWMRRLSQRPWELRFRRSTLRYHLTTHDSHTRKKLRELLMDASTGPRAASHPVDLEVCH
jgi:hypothetical protein